MTDAEISRALALAIGWPENSVSVVEPCCVIWFGRDARGFDHRDPAVIWPIAERYRCFPWQWEWDYPDWCARMPNAKKTTIADTAAKAVALAVIGGKA